MSDQFQEQEEAIPTLTEQFPTLINRDTQGFDEAHNTASKLVKESRMLNALIHNDGISSEQLTDLAGSLDEITKHIGGLLLHLSNIQIDLRNLSSKVKAKTESSNGSEG